MNEFFSRFEFRIRIAIAVLAGGMISLAFPRTSIAGLAWVGPGLMLFAALGASRKRAFWSGYFGGLGFYLPTLYWLLHMPVGWEKVLGWIALCAYLGLYSGAWVWCCWRIFPGEKSTEENDSRDERTEAQSRSRRGDEAEIPTLTKNPPRDLGGYVERAGIIRRAVWALACAGIWVALEVIVGRLFTGFPWVFLGTSQYRILPVTQIASLTGVYGVSFLAVWFSVALGCAVVLLVRQPQRRWLAMGDIVVPMLAVALVAAFGMSRLAQRAPPTHEIKIAMVQPSIPQTLIWNPAENTNRFNKLLAMSRTVLAEKPDVLLWPEAAVPGLLRYDSFVADAIGRLAQENRVWMIIGADDAEPDRASPKPDAIRVFNSSFLISPEGRLESKYDKRQLVIFGEYIPLIRWLPFLKWFTPIEGGFADGDRVVPFAIGQPRTRTAVLICFEDVFPHLAREYVDEQTDFLVNLTNDGWFSEGAAQWQQAAMAVFRAIENAVPLVRCTNNGLTCWIDECGRLDEDYFRAGRDIYGEGTRIVKLPLLPEGGRRALTFYTRHGDVFGWACVALMALRFGPIAWRAVRSAKFFRRAVKA